MRNFKNGWQLITYAVYHDLNVFVLFDDKDELYFEKINNKRIALYMFEDDKVPSNVKVKLMSFSNFYELIINSGIEYFDYYYDTKDRQGAWHIDAYSSFTKEELDEYLKDNEDSRYDFLKIS